MTRFLRIVLILGFISVAIGCGQKGDLYMPSEQVAHQLVL